MKKIIAILILINAILSCDLERDNPIDIYAVNYSNKTGSENDENNNFDEKVTYSHYIIASKQNTSFGTIPLQTILAGETIYLQIYLNNAGSISFNEVEGNVSLESKFANLETIPSGKRIVFHNDLPTLNLNSGQGYGDLTDSSSFSYAPNLNSYCAKISVYDFAKTGDSIKLDFRASFADKSIQKTIYLTID